MRRKRKRESGEGSGNSTDIDITELPEKRRGRPTLSFEDLEVQLKAKLREKGGVVNTAITIAVAETIFSITHCYTH